jgi:asparagine synthase (glutamine-hydrolysing)
MLYKVDRASMAASLEVRVPYLDNTVIDYALTLPLNKKSTTVYEYKAPLKELLSKLAPHYDTTKPKRGFNFPLTDWLHKYWKDQVVSTITKSKLEAVGLPAQPFLGIVEKFYKGVKCTNEVWYLFNLLLWHDNFKTKYKNLIK